MNRNKAAEGFALLADPNRLEILRILSNGEQNAAGLLKNLPVSQPTLSHHMRLLWEGGLVERRRQGQRVIYTLCRPALQELLAIPLGETSSGPAPEGRPSGMPRVIIRSGHQ